MASSTQIETGKREVSKGKLVAVVLFFLSFWQCFFNSTRSRSLFSFLLLIYAAGPSEVVRLLMVLVFPLQHRRRLVFRTGGEVADANMSGRAREFPLCFLSGRLNPVRLQPLFPVLTSRDCPNSIRQVCDVLVSAFRAQFVQGRFETPEVIPVRTARASATIYVLGELLWVLRADKLVIVGRANVHQRSDGVIAVMIPRQ